MGVAFFCVCLEYEFLIVQIKSCKATSVVTPKDSEIYVGKLSIIFYQIYVYGFSLIVTANELVNRMFKKNNVPTYDVRFLIISRLSPSVRSETTAKENTIPEFLPSKHFTKHFC